MAGGRGSRLGFIEKPLIKINNKFLIDYIIEEVKKSKIEDFYIATSP
ncbi:NTP transferase domain-containing protein, partial [Methanocaldococcus sp.]